MKRTPKAVRKLFEPVMDVLERCLAEPAAAEVFEAAVVLGQQRRSPLIMGALLEHVADLVLGDGGCQTFGRQAVQDAIWQRWVVMVGGSEWAEWAVAQAPLKIERLRPDQKTHALDVGNGKTYYSSELVEELFLAPYVKWRRQEESGQPERWGSRPRGSGEFASREECWQTLVDALVTLRGQRRRLTQEQLADYLPGRRNVRQIRRWLNAWHPPIVWDELVAAARRGTD